MRRFLEATLFPFIAVSTIVAVFVFYRTGVDPDFWVVYTYNATAIVLTVFEYLIPRNPNWNYINKNGIRFKEAAIEIGFYFYGEALGKSILLPLATWIVGTFHLNWNFSAVRTDSVFSTGVEIVLIFFLIDFVRYWIHRWEHRFPILWRWHAFHHMAPRLSALTATRSHPFDDILLYLPETVVLLALGFDVRLVAGVYSLVWVVSLVKHANIDLRAGWMSRFFQLPRYHLIHHELHGAEDPTFNFAEVTVLWDWAFGTLSGGPVSSGHEVGVESRGRRGLFRELFGSFYLPVQGM